MTPEEFLRKHGIPNMPTQFVTEDQTSVKNTAQALEEYAQSKKVYIDLKFKYTVWIGDKHADISGKLWNNDVQKYALEFAEYVFKNNFAQSKEVTEEEINEQFPEYNSSGKLLDYNLARREGAKWLKERTK